MDRHKPPPLLAPAATAAAPSVAYPTVPVVGQAISTAATALQENRINSAAKGDFGAIGGSLLGTGSAALGAGSAAYPYASTIQAAAAKYGLDPNTLAALIQKESNFNPLAKNPTSSATGLTQLLTGTAGDLGVTDRTDPTQSIFGGAQYLRQQMDSFGNPRTALAAYYQGPGAVQTGGISAAGGQYADEILAQSAKYASAVTQTAQTAQTAAGGFGTAFPSALASIMSTIGSAISGAGGNVFASVSGGLFGGGRASGGPIAPGMDYLVGERGPEMFRSSVPGHIMPSLSGRGESGGGKFMLEIMEGPMFAAKVRAIAGAGDIRTLKAARKSYPDTAARFGKLGTTNR